MMTAFGAKDSMNDGEEVQLESRPFAICLLGALHLLIQFGRKDMLFFQVHQ